MTDAEAVDGMSPAELRTKLAEFGLPLMPITASTKATMVKKLKMLMAASHPNSNSNSRRSLAKYSSGEESDLEPVNANSNLKPQPQIPAKKNRKSMPPPPPSAPLPTTRSRRTPVKTVTDEEEEDEEEAPVRTVRIVRSYAPPPRREEQHDGYETGSDSEIDTPAPPPRSYSPLPTSRPTSTTVHTNPYTASDLNSIRSRLGLAHTFTEKPSYKYFPTYKSPTTTTTTEHDDIDSPYLSNFTRKLSALKAEAQDRLRDSDVTNGSNARPYEYRRRVDLSPDFKTAGEKNILKNNIVSLGIVGAFIAFFAVVSFMYIGMKSDVAFIIEDKNNVVPICSLQVPEHRESINCILKDKLANTMDLLKILYPELSSRAVSSKCDNVDVMPHMTENDIVNFVKKNYGNKESRDIIQDLYNLHVLLLNNPKWGVSIIKAPHNMKADVNAALTSIEYVRPIRNAGQTALAILSPSIPLRCYLFQKLHSFFLYALIVGLALGALYGIQKSVKMYLDYKKKTNDDVYSMVTQIIDVVSQDIIDDNTESNGQSMPISHVRDMLIPPQNRDKMSAIWNAAIKFIEKNESRVRFEVESVGGEEYRAMRWVSAQGSPRVTRGGARAWQGQAFETQQGSVNNLAFSPTPCLKIRHMVDKNDKNPNQKTIIQDAILEKCGPQCKILHIEIDKVSCCVFVKCVSPADAGIIYQNLHGWWYEGNLITVKYLRLERYMDHFPNSPAAGPFLKPSNQ